MRTARPALRLRCGRSDLTIFHWKIVRAVLTLRSRSGRSPGNRSPGAFPFPDSPPHSATAENTPSDRDVVPSRNPCVQTKSVACCPATACPRRPAKVPAPSMT